MEDYTLLVVIEGQGACCDTLTAECRDDVPVADCRESGAQWLFYHEQSCADLNPPCGVPGACCDAFTGECTDAVPTASCTTQHYSGRPCTWLDPPCGGPGCCCDDETGLTSCTLWRDCNGRFIPMWCELCGDLDESGVVDAIDYGMFLDTFGLWRRPARLQPAG